VDNNLGIWPFTKWYEGKSDKEVAMRVFGEFVSIAEKVYPLTHNKKLSYDADDLYNYFKGQKGNQIEQLAGGVRMADISRRTIENAMENMAEQTSGSFPVHISGFINALSGEAVSTPISDTVMTVHESVQATVVDPLKTGLQTVKGINQYLPYFLAVAGVFGVGYLVSQGKGAGKLIGKLVKKTKK
jgi:hypothetical protein